MLSTVGADKDATDEKLSLARLVPSPALLSPIPSPTPSSVSSISDQEVPSMSPGFVRRKAEKRGRKRDIVSVSEASMIEYPTKARRSNEYPVKARRADSTGDFEEYSRCEATNFRRYPSQQQRSYQQHEQAEFYPPAHKQISRSSCQFASPNHMAISRLHHKIQYTEDVYSHPHHCKPGPRHTFWNTQNFSSQNCYMQQQHQEPVPDFAELVSWMLAENFLDTESLTALLARC